MGETHIRPDDRELGDDYLKTNISSSLKEIRVIVGLSRDRPKPVRPHSRLRATAEPQP
jgi:hypothetical protein